MRDHEIIEIVILTVCEYYNVHWKSILGSKRGRRYDVTNEELLARHLCFHLLYMFTSEDMAAEIMEYKVTSLAAVSHRVRETQSLACKETLQIINHKTAA